MDCDTLIDLKRPAVRRLLGRPDGEEGKYWWYDTGTEPGPVGIDEEILSIGFEDGRVIKVELSDT
ncbi:MAG: hypothetical protein QOG26_412 [Solirubrobacterales bacterium]|jgi:hypothetical protein|nr:hypothetical protein [Solirubrobacterales bacterium]